MDVTPGGSAFSAHEPVNGVMIMNVERIIEVVKKAWTRSFLNAYQGYFFGEWTIPWLPDDL